MTPIAPDWIDALPPLLHPDQKNLYLRPTSNEAIALMQAYRTAQGDAQDAALAFAKAHDAVAFWPPIGGERTVTVYAFDTKPEDQAKSWSFLPQRARDRHYKGVANKKTVAGKVLQEAMAALPPFPREDEIGAHANALHSVCYEADGGGYGVSNVGFNEGIDTAVVAWSGETFFLCLGNPMHTLRSMMSWNDRAQANFGGNGYAGKVADVPGWRPPEGWALLSRAEVDLIYAQNAVAAEKAAAA